MKNIKPQIWPKYSLNEINLVTNVLKSGKVNYWTGKEIKYFWAAIQREKQSEPKKVKDTEV